MLIDFHTHIFPKKLAPRAISALQAGVLRTEGTESVCHTDATYEGLLKSMTENGVDMSVALPIVTNPEKPDGVNDYAETIRTDRVLSFGSVHPLQKDAAGAVYKLRERGFIGIKLHPEFQHCYINSPKTLAVLRAARDAGMVVMLHAGADIGMPPPVHCTPEMLSDTLLKTDCPDIIAAHLGGWRMWDKVLAYLAKSPLYMDTAFIGGFIDDDLCREIIKTRGADKILFGSDSPWETPANTLKYLSSLGLNSEDMEKIKYKNAKNLLLQHTVNVGGM